MNCEAVETGNIAERYVLGQLSEADRDAFEEHYYVCAKCFEDLRILQAIPAPPAMAARTPRRTLWVAIAAAVIVMFGVAAGTRLWRSAPVQAPALTATTPAAGRAAELQLLARVDPPHYTAAILRGQGGEAERRYRSAMEIYTRGDYASAAGALQAVVGSAPEMAAPRFYLGVCDLLTARPEQAAIELTRTAAMGETPFLEEARFFLAKALLAKADTAEAERVLVLTVEMHGDREMEARRMLEQLKKLP